MMKPFQWWFKVELEIAKTDDVMESVLLIAAVIYKAAIVIVPASIITFILA